MRKSVHSILLLLCLVGIRVHAQERLSFYTGVRQMGMGGASIATVNDETALLANPAALGKLRDHFITVADPELEVGQSTEAVAKTNLLQMINPQSALNACNTTPDKNLHERAQVFPSIVLPNFGFGFFGKYQVDAITNSSTNLFQYNYTNDYAMVLGGSFKILNGIIKMGSNLRLDNRTQVINSSIPTTSTNLSLNSLASSGVGLASDTGLIITAPISYLPTLSAVYRDVGQTAYNFHKSYTMTTTTVPAATPNTVDAALAIYPILAKRVRSSWTVEYQDVLTAGKETDQLRRVHAGVEVNLADAIFLRAGLNQRYWTAGFEFSMGNYQFQAASYGEDIGTPASPLEDRRYDLKFAFRF